MTPEERLFEATIVAGLVATGWIEGDRARVQPDRALLPDDLLDWLRDAHPEQWERLSRAHGETLGQRLVNALDDALKKSSTPEVLRRGYSFEGEAIELACFPPPNALNPATTARAKRNRLVVTRQAPIEAGSGKTVDLMFSLNGVPVATVELKHRPNAQDAGDARRQYLARPKNLPIFRWPSRAVVHFAVDEQEAWMTTRVDGADTAFVPFNRGTIGGGGNPPNPDGYPTDYLWKDVWARESFLSLLQRYVHLLLVPVERDGQRTHERRMLFPRWHQRDAVRALVRDVEERGPGQRYLIEHSAGSGKSNTIAWLAWHLADLPYDGGNLFDKVVVVTDRTVLDSQLAETIEQMTTTPARVCHVRDRVRVAQRGWGAAGEASATGGGKLGEALDNPGVRIVIVTAQTFRNVPEALADRPRRSFAVLLDEAHSGVGEKTDEAMSRALRESVAPGADDLIAYARQRQQPNQSLFAFTATPQPQTLIDYGRYDPAEDKHVAFHQYTMSQAIAEGFIVDPRLGYVRYETYFRLRGVGVDDPEVDQKTATAAIMRQVSQDPKVMGAKSHVIVRHFLTMVRDTLGGRARAMVVAPSRVAAVGYKRALETELAAQGAEDVGVLVAFSDVVTDPKTGKVVRETDLNGCRESEVPRRFATGKDRILVVANKYQTGFDQPLLAAMYIDRALEGVQAVQTLSRLNRPCGPGTKKVFALDFVNATEVLDGFARFLEGTRLGDAPTPEMLDDLKERLDAAGVYSDAEVLEVAELVLTPSALTRQEAQEKISGVLSVAVGRYEALSSKAREAFRGALTEFLRVYSLVERMVEAPERGMVALSIYGAWLVEKLVGPAQARAFVDLKGQIAVEYVRVSRAGGGLAEAGPNDGGGDDSAPGDVTLSTRSGARPVDPTVRLSVLLQQLNERYGVGAAPADRSTLEAIIEELLGNEEVLGAVQATADARELIRDGEIQKQIRRRFRERQRGGDALVMRFLDDDALRDELMQIVLEMVQRRAPEAAEEDGGELSREELTRLAELGVLRNSLEPRLRGFVRRTLEGVHGDGWFDELMRSVPTELRTGLAGVEPEVVLRERLYLSTLVAAIDRGWTTAFGAVLESAPMTERLSREQCIALLQVLNAHREDAHARPIREADLTTVRAVVAQLHRVLDRVSA
ncbi:MAG: DEAD/DEAH box helicase family protein [Deltaproteobacteria bacterium]|nr:DEAD/DEAH box helicase family protein [Myxococcales bacterium]MDP3217889.1 DEAD/DEAH box helicase family protein [Deltaproteobacteria bacterium]